MSITGVIKVTDLPDDTCLTTVRELILSLERFLAVEFDAEQVTNVIVSSVEPETTERNIIWFRTDNSGNFLGINVFIQGEWIQMFPPPNSIIRMYGRSTELPQGYALVSTSVPGFTPPMVAKLQESWVLQQPGGQYYVLFDVVYVGL